MQGYDIQSFLAATNFPKDPLHPAIREQCWTVLIQSANAGKIDELRVAIQSARTQCENGRRLAGQCSLIFAHAA